MYYNITNEPARGHSKRSAPYESRFLFQGHVSVLYSSKSSHESFELAQIWSERSRFDDSYWWVKRWSSFNGAARWWSGTNHNRYVVVFRLAVLRVISNLGVHMAPLWYLLMILADECELLPFPMHQYPWIRDSVLWSFYVMVPGMPVKHKSTVAYDTLAVHVLLSSTWRMLRATFSPEKMFPTTCHCQVCEVTDQRHHNQHIIYN